MFPRVKLEGLSLSKIVCGTNQFVGISHEFGFHRLRDPGLIHRSPLSTLYYALKFKDTRKVVEIMQYLAVEHGVNACISSPRQSIHDAIKAVERETGEKYHWICSPSKRQTVKGLAPDMNAQIDWCAEHGVSVCMPHRSYTDNALDPVAGTIEGLPALTAKIRDLGMIPGLSTHAHQVPGIVERQGYDVKLIVQPVNKIGFEANTTVEAAVQAVKTTRVQVINIKPMAAGRIRPKEGIEFCLDAIKDNDLLAIGFGDMAYAIEDAGIATAWFDRHRAP